MQDLKPCMVILEKNDIMKPKIYLSDYAIEGNNCWSIIVITYDEYNFLC